ncbi:hypothetical protein BJ508DRAFT_358899 [Ascobolus immersus RN42]|uniref:Uncharacterized protein n=1 Tax=Ascobolus immersus RN42 TaxID=1160509 RepID=A0A3N4ILH7_ASCIM|nr:hypothetical protein BJ508DRAFT_358899 [Ascobolus immersus RN42]
MPKTRQRFIREWLLACSSFTVNNDGTVEPVLEVVIRQWRMFALHLVHEAMCEKGVTPKAAKNWDRQRYAYRVASRDPLEVKRGVPQFGVWWPFGDPDKKAEKLDENVFGIESACLLAYYEGLGRRGLFAHDYGTVELPGLEIEDIAFGQCLINWRRKHITEGSTREIVDGLDYARCVFEASMNGGHQDKSVPACFHASNPDGSRKIVTTQYVFWV